MLQVGIKERNVGRGKNEKTCGDFQRPKTLSHMVTRSRHTDGLIDGNSFSQRDEA